MNELKEVNISDKKREFDQFGATVFSREEFLFSDADWDLIYEIAEHERLPIEIVTIGDVGEPNEVGVGRFMTDIEKPEVVNREFSDPLLSVLYSDELKQFFSSFFKKENLFLRRCQLNIIKAGGFIGQHLDCDSNPDYLAAIIIHLDNDFEGGQFYYYPNDKAKLIECEKNCVILSSCLIAHEVKKVAKGTRRTIVFFLSEEQGLNKSEKLIMR